MTNYTNITKIVTLLNETEMMIPGLIIPEACVINSEYLDTRNAVTLLVPRRFQSMILTGWMERNGYMLNDISTYTFNVDGTKISFDTFERLYPSFETEELNLDIAMLDTAVFYPIDLESGASHA